MERTQLRTPRSASSGGRWVGFGVGPTNRSRLMGMVMVGAMVAGLGPLAGTAAALPVTARIVPTSATDSVADKSATANCPAGKKLVGTGSNINGAGGLVRVYQLSPNATLDSLTVRAIEQPGGTNLGWSVTALAVCTSLNLNLDRRIAASALNSSSPKSATAACLPGQTLLGTAAVVTGGAQGVVIDDIYPHSGLDAVTVWAVEGQGGTAADWVVRAVAICSDSPSVLVAREEAVSATSSDTSRTVTAECDEDWTLVGTGYAIDIASGQVMIQDVTPSGSGVTTPTGVTVRAVEDQDGTAVNWRVKAYAICSAPPEN